jgi:predicted GIY-YIG superfamily endonuclease
MCYTVYGIYDKATDELLYIGLTSNAIDRERAHRRGINATMAALLNGGASFDFRVLSEHPDYYAANDEEKRLIFNIKPIGNTRHTKPLKVSEPRKTIKRSAITEFPVWGH